MCIRDRSIGIITATLLVFSGTGGLEALEKTIILVGLPFFIMGYFQMYALYRALREDAGELPPMRTRRWKKVLPPEEYARRQDEDEHDTSDTVVDPEAADEVPVMADPYVDEVDASGAQDMGRRRRLPEGTISSRTGSAKITYGRAED